MSNSETVLMIRKGGKHRATIGLNSCPKFHFLQKVDLEDMCMLPETHPLYRDEIERLSGRIWSVKYEFKTTTLLNDNKEWDVEFKTLVKVNNPPTPEAMGWASSCHAQPSGSR